MEGYDHAHLFIHDPDSGLFEKGKHGTLAAREVFAGCPVGADGGQYAGQQVELIGHEGIDLGKVLLVGVQLFLRRVIEHDEVLDDGGLLFVEKTERLRGSLCLL